jgi:hypothetical protein
MTNDDAAADTPDPADSDNDDRDPAPDAAAARAETDAPRVEGETSSPPADDPAAGGVIAGGHRGHRVTRRTVRRRETAEDLEETITEEVPIEAYQAPTAAHPAPVG